MDAPIEGRVGTLGSFGRQRAGDESGAEHGLRLEQAGKRIGARELGAVEQRQPFLGAQRERFQPCSRQRFGRGHAHGVDENFTAADHCRRHMCQRCKIAARADRTLARDHRGQALHQHRLQQRNRFRPDTGSALAETGQLQRHHQPHNVDRRWLSGTGSMAEHNIPLQGRQIILINADAGEFSKTGVDSVYRFVFGQNPCDRCGAFGNRSGGGWSQPCARAAIDCPPVGQRHLARNQDNLGQRPLL